MAHLSLTFLGAFQATLNDEPLTAFRSARVQGLLVYLVLTNHQSHSRDVLAALFWPDEPDTVAKKNLRQSLYQLRQLLGETDSLGESYLLVTRSTVQFNPASNHSLDVTSFLAYLDNTELEQAVALYRGDLLPGFTCNSLPFEEWLRQERESLHRLVLDALYELADRSLARGDYQTAQNWAQQQLALEPWREEAHRQLIQALALLGERSAALAQYAACRVVMDEELGAGPSQETESLVARIRDYPREQVDRRAPAHPFERRRLTTPFVGREDEHGALVRAYQQASMGSAQVVAVFGEAGIGKTRLSGHFLNWAATQGADILRGRAFETSGGLSYQPFTDALRQRLERENAPEDLLSDVWLTQLTHILPELRDRYPDLPPPTQEESTGRQHLFEAITRLVQALAERAPVVIFIDDWHWADAASMDLLHYAALRWSEERVPVLVLLTLRQEALTEAPDLQTWLTRFKHDVSCIQMDLATLSALETERLIHLLLEPGQGNSDTPDTVEKPAQLTTFGRWLFKETDGQPFFMVETLKVMVEEGLVWRDTDSEGWRVDWTKFDDLVGESRAYVSSGVREVIRNWLNRISTHASELLVAAAVLGHEVSFDHLCQVAELEEIQAVAALDELVVKQLLLEETGALSGPGQGPSYSFTHQMLGEVVYSEAGAARRRILHRRAFDVLRPAAPAAELAHHALNGGLMAEAIWYSSAAGNEAMRLFALRVAIIHYETAWQLAEQKGWPETISGADKQDLYINLGRVYELTEAWSQAQDIYQAMIVDAQAIGAPTMECLALNRLAMVYVNGLHDPQQASTLLKEAHEMAEQNGDRRGLAEAEWGLSTAARMEQDTHQARYHGEQALTIARELGHPQLLARCLNSLAYVHSRLRQWDRVEAYADEAGHLYAAAGNRVLEADSHRMVGWSQMYSGRPQDSLATLRHAFSFSQQSENLWGLAECDWRLAFTLKELGHYGEAIERGRQAVKRARKVGMPTMVVLALVTLGTVQRTVMALEAAQETLSGILAESAEKAVTGYGDWALAELCAVQALRGDWNRAHLLARQTLQSREDETLLPMGLTGWYETEALLRGGDGNLARAEIERLSKIVGQNPRYQLPLFRSQAVLAEWEGDTVRAIQHLQAAAALAQEIGLPGEEWSILGALGTLCAEQGNQTQAQQAWKVAADIILRLANAIDEEDLRAGFLAAEVVRAILAHNGEM